MENISLLKKIEIFQGLTSFELATVGKLLKTKTFKTGEQVVKEGEEGKSLFIIKSGKVKVVGQESEENEEILALLKSGDHFGEIALIDNQPRSASIIANEDSTLMEISRDDLEELCGNNANLAVKIYKAFAIALCARLRDANEHLLLHIREGK